jgi:hypothetical protein
MPFVHAERDPVPRPFHPLGICITPLALQLGSDKKVETRRDTSLALKAPDHVVMLGTAQGIGGPRLAHGTGDKGLRWGGFEKLANYAAGRLDGSVTFL